MNTILIESHSKTINELKEAGFHGFMSIKELWHDRSSIPKEMGVYLVLNPSHNSPEFIAPGVGGFFKGKDPNVSVDVLISNFVGDPIVIYIGKAGGPTKKSTLHSRLGQYLSFGRGKNVGHWGGRYIWQLTNHEDLLLCWMETPGEDPRDVEKRLLSQYCEQFGKYPFANLSS